MSDSDGGCASAADIASPVLAAVIAYESDADGTEVFAEVVRRYRETSRRRRYDADGLDTAFGTGRKGS